MTDRFEQAKKAKRWTLAEWKAWIRGQRVNVYADFMTEHGFEGTATIEEAIGEPSPPPAHSFPARVRFGSDPAVIRTISIAHILDDGKIP